MGRLACVDLPALPSALRAGVVSADEVRNESSRVAEALGRLSPDVEVSADEPGVYWLSGEGLGLLFGSASEWGRAIRTAVAAQGYAASIVVGFTRFGSYAVAKRGRPLAVFRDREAERRAAREAPLDRLGIDPRFRDWLKKLGVHTLGQFLALPRDGLLLRFGKDASRLHELGAGSCWDPVQPQAAEHRFEQRIDLDDPECDASRLLFAIKGALGRLLSDLAARHRACGALRIGLRLDHAGEQRELLEPAEPTLDERDLSRLIHLRLESAPPRAGVRAIHLEAVDVPAKQEQLVLFQKGQRRDLRAANEVLAQLRAELGNGAVTKAVLCDGHLPEAQFSWQPLLQLSSPAPRRADKVLVRRIRSRAAEVSPPVSPPPVSPPSSPPPRHARDDGWLPSGLEQGAVQQLHGPHLVSGQWWRAEVRREYAFAELKRGQCLWLYYDRGRRRWCVQGAIA